MNIDAVIKDILPEENYIHGYADLAGLLNPKYGAVPRAVTLGRRLDDAVIDELKESGPTQAYYDHYVDVNSELELNLARISGALKEHNINHVVIKPTLKDAQLEAQFQKTLTYDFSHKMAATQAGLGWIGKTDLFISERFGPRLRLGTVLTDMALPVSKSPYRESRCGTCALCVDACPAQAASGRLWDVHTAREEFYNPFRCREKCRELAKKNIDKNESICGICISVCPVGKKNRR